jgi:hypothetical protein
MEVEINEHVIQRFRQRVNPCKTREEIICFLRHVIHDNRNNVRQRLQRWKTKYRHQSYIEFRYQGGVYYVAVTQDLTRALTILNEQMFKNLKGGF